MEKKLTLFSFYRRNQDIDCVIHENLFGWPNQDSEFLNR